MLIHHTKFLAAIGLALTLTGPAHAVPVYNETTNGDFSNNRAAPTLVNFTLGENDVFGQTGNFSGVTDLDYFTFAVPTGARLVSLTVLNSAVTSGALAFFAVQQGGAITVDPGPPTPSAATLLGYKHIGPTDIGINILPAMGTSVGALGFSAPLGAGQYAAWLQDTSPGASSYSLRFNISAIPEPATALLALAGIAALARVRRRRQT